MNKEPKKFPYMDTEANCLTSAFFIDPERAKELETDVIRPLVLEALDEKLSRIEVLASLRESADSLQEWAWMAPGIFEAIRSEANHRRDQRMQKGLKMILGLDDDQPITFKKLF